MTSMTTPQQQRTEALNSAASLLVDRSATPASLFSKGVESMKAQGMLADDTEVAILMAEYIVSGPGPTTRNLHLVIDENGTRIEESE